MDSGNKSCNHEYKNYLLLKECSTTFCYLVTVAQSCNWLLNKVKPQGEVAGKEVNIAPSKKPMK